MSATGLDALRDTYPARLVAEHKSRNTIEGYLDSLLFFEQFLVDARLPTDVALIGPEHVSRSSPLVQPPPPRARRNR